MVQIKKVRWLAGMTLLLVCVFAYTLLARDQIFALECENNDNPALCYTTSLEGVLERDGVAAALESLATIYVSDQEFQRYCHGNVHDIGKAAYKMYHAVGNVEITHLASYCGFGYYHGFMEEMLAESGSLDESKNFCRTVGETMRDVQPYAEGACYHGIGHGVTDGTNPADWGDPVALITPGLILCRKISSTDEWLMRCSSGVFNSLALMYQDETYKLGRPNDPFALCAQADLQNPERESCYSQMNTLVAFLSDHDPKMALSYTHLIANPELRRTAIMNIMAMPRQWRDGGEEASITVCRDLRDTTTCLRGVVSGMMEFGSPGNEIDRAFEYCSHPSLGPIEKSECMAEIVSMSRGMFSEDKVRTICRLIPSESRPLACSQIESGV